MGSVDAVAHNAGRGNLNSIEQTPTTVWRHMFALNVDAPFFLTRALLPHFRQRGSGHMVYVSSMAGRIGYPYNAAYVAAKHALVGFVAALRAELEGTEINATVVCPSGVSSEWGDVTEDGSINDLYTRAIPRSRVLAREQGLPYAPLKKLITSATAAEIIASVITGARSNDVYTHEGTMELALEAVTDRKALEDQHKALWLAMREVYQQMQDAK
jgi:NAD(P)-dependent dehydrogenase (short-subunit alcohol dehydrogenase family)